MLLLALFGIYSTSGFQVSGTLPTIRPGSWTIFRRYCCGLRSTVRCSVLSEPGRSMAGFRVSDVMPSCLLGYSGWSWDLLFWETPWASFPGLVTLSLVLKSIIACSRHANWEPRLRSGLIAWYGWSWKSLFSPLPVKPFSSFQLYFYIFLSTRLWLPLLSFNWLLHSCTKMKGNEFGYFDLCKQQAFPSSSNSEFTYTNHYEVFTVCWVTFP